MTTNDSPEGLALATHVAELLLAVLNRSAANGVEADANPAFRTLLLRILDTEVDLKSVLADELERALQI
jgi:hypothetical protein